MQIVEICGLQPGAERFAASCHVKKKGDVMKGETELCLGNEKRIRAVSPMVC
ncbi:hypothetical protein [Suipraeoptans intestinalis]|uniref:hypothetical protein n=1 Tax=Suipraeoptans intestinalis TaxID=2606628 RepID=UPI003A7F12C3